MQYNTNSIAIHQIGKYLLFKTETPLLLNQLLRNIYIWWLESVCFLFLRGRGDLIPPLQMKCDMKK
jgi:hypothetical protein